MGMDFVDLDVMSRFLRDILRHQSRAWDPAVANAGELLADGKTRSFSKAIVVAAFLSPLLPAFTSSLRRIQSGGGGCVTRKAVVSDPTALLEAVREDLTEKGTLQHWQAAADALAKSLGEGKEEAELILAKAFGWTGWFQLNRPSYLKPKLPPAPEQITQALRWLSDGPLQLSPQQLKVALAKKPQVYLLDPRASYEKALEVAPEQWRSAEAFRALLLKKPQVLDLTHNCLLTDPAERVINEDGEAVHCDGRCTNCWRVATPRLMGQVLDGVEV